jgi:hypothetical protein
MAAEDVLLQGTHGETSAGRGQHGHALGAFYYHVTRIWLRTLRRRGQKDRFSEVSVKVCFVGRPRQSPR